MMPDIKTIFKGITKEVPGARKILEEMDSEQTKKLVERQHEEKIQSLSDLVAAINALNPNTGREFVFRTAICRRMVYKKEIKNTNESFLTWDYFNAGNRGIETAYESDTAYYTAFFISAIFNNDDRDTTIYEIELDTYTEDACFSSIPDMYKIDGGKWTQFNYDEFILPIKKNSTHKLFFRFLSKKMYSSGKLPIRFRLKHTSGEVNNIEIADFVNDENVPEWAEKGDTSKFTGISVW